MYIYGCISKYTETESKAMKETANAMDIESNAYYDYNSDSYLYINEDELTDFDYYWYDEEVWDTSDIVTIDNGYKNTNYQMKCIKDEKMKICACQSNNYGPIYQCQQTLYEPHFKGMCLYHKRILILYIIYDELCSFDFYNYNKQIQKQRRCHSMILASDHHSSMYFQTKCIILL